MQTNGREHGPGKRLTGVASRPRWVVHRTHQRANLTMIAQSGSTVMRKHGRLSG